MILQHLCKLRCDLLCCFKLFYQWLDFSPKWELAVASLMGNPMRRRETYETILVDVQVVGFVKETIFRRQIWFTPGFHCADITRKLVFSSNFCFTCQITRNFQHFEPDFCAATDVMLGPQMNPGGLFIGREFRRRNSSGEPTSRCDA